MNATKRAPAQRSAERLGAFDAVVRLTPLSRSRIIRLTHPGSFPLPVKVGPAIRPPSQAPTEGDV